MCLIISCPKGISKNSEFLSEAIKVAAENNPDGIGYIIKRSDSSVKINKGIFNVKELNENLKKEDVKDEDELHIHFRIGNKGAISKEMCHPFVATPSKENIDNILESVVDYPVLMHNGTMYSYSVTNSVKSDTYFFTRNILSNKHVINMIYNDQDIFKDLIDPHVDNSRLLIVSPGDAETIYIGKWYTNNNILFSKNYPKEYEPKIPYYNGMFNRGGNYVNRKFNHNNHMNSILGGYDEEYDDYYDEQSYEKYKMNQLRKEQEEQYADLFSIRNEYSDDDDDDDDDLPFNMVVTETNDLTGYDGSIELENYGTILVPDIDFPRRSIKNILNINYKYYMGLYVPSDHMPDHYLVAVDDGNYDYIDISPIKTDATLGIWKSLSYEIIGVRNNMIIIMNRNTLEEMALSHRVFYSLFKIELVGYSKVIYSEYANMLSSIPPSKNVYKHLNKMLEKWTNSPIGFDMIEFKHNSRRYTYSIDAVELYIEKCEEELNLRKSVLST